MLAARDQENLVHAQQTTAAGKPLNQGIRNLHPKTPGPTKTPFRRALNDENRPLTQKGKNNVVLKDGPSKLDKNTFVTPAPNRAPLGMKTTNARGQAFKTPLPQQQNVKQEKTLKKASTARRSAKSKITVAPSEPVQTDVLSQVLDDDDEIPCEYAPPPVADLPDPPMDFGYDTNYPQFEGSNFFKGYEEIYCRSPTDLVGPSFRQKEEARRKKRQEEMEAKALEPIAFTPLPTDEELDAKVDRMIAAGLKQSRLNTVKARSAASALSRPTMTIPSVAMKGTKASEQKRKPLSNITAFSGPRDVPNSVSRNTIGFPKAKKAPSIIPAADQMRQKKPTPKSVPIDQSEVHPRDFIQLYGQPPVGSTMWDRLKEYELLEEQDIANGVSDTLFDTDFFGAEEPDFGLLKNDDEVFQLPMPE